MLRETHLLLSLAVCDTRARRCLWILVPLPKVIEPKRRIPRRRTARKKSEESRESLTLPNIDPGIHQSIRPKGHQTLFAQGYAAMPRLYLLVFE